MSGSIISRAVQQNLKELKKEPKDEDFQLPAVRDPDDGWRRVYLRLEIVQLAAWNQTLLLELTTLPSRKKSVRLEDMFEDEKMVYVARAQIISRETLKKSGSMRHCGPKDECTHTILYKRGGRILWWTCSYCGTRWPRRDNEILKDNQI